MASLSSDNLAAVLESKNAPVTITFRAIPSPGPGELLIRNRAIAANPVDWKIQAHGLFIEEYPTVLGSDVCGEVISIGPNVTHFAPGDRVTGYAGVVYNHNIDHGAWQTYCILPELGSCKIPETMGFEEGAVFPMGMATAGVALFEILGFPREKLKEDARQGVIVWGAASSVGASATQIACVMGWKVIATASPRHHEWLKKLGVTEVFDYKDPKVLEKIEKAAKDKDLVLQKAVDCISEGDTLDFVPDALTAAGGGGGKIATVLWRPEGKAEPEGIEIGLAVGMRHALDLKDFGRWFFNEWLEEHLATGSVVPAPEIQIVHGGVAAAQKVFDLLKAGVSGKKLVVQVE